MVMVVVLVIPPPFAVTVILWVPTEMLGPTLIDMVEVPLPGAGMVLGLKLAPLKLAVSAIDELKPPVAAVVIVEVPVAPCLITSLVGFALTVKLPPPPPAARALIKAAPFGLPQPVTRSYNGVAVKPLLPLVMSWKSVV